VYLLPEDRSEASLGDFCGLKEAGVMDAIQIIREKDCCLLDVAKTFKTPVVLVLFIDTPKWLCTQRNNVHPEFQHGWSVTGNFYVFR